MWQSMLANVTNIIAPMAVGKTFKGNNTEWIHNMELQYN